MAKSHGIPGEWARVKGSICGLWPLFIGIFAAGFSSAIMFGDVLWGGVFLVASFVYCGWSLNKGLKRVERFFKGARGEEKVAGILRELPDAYHVFNDFPASNMRIDHVVVGPSGI